MIKVIRYHFCDYVALVCNFFSSRPSPSSFDDASYCAVNHHKKRPMRQRNEVVFGQQSTGNWRFDYNSTQESATSNNSVSVEGNPSPVKSPDEIPAVELDCSLIRDLEPDHSAKLCLGSWPIDNSYNSTKNCPIKNGQKTCIDISPKKLYKQLTSMGKEAQHH